jgi:hypothetical protein
MARKPSAVARELLRNFPRSGGRRRRRRGKNGGRAQNGGGNGAENGRKDGAKAANREKLERTTEPKADAAQG